MNKRNFFTLKDIIIVLLLFAIAIVIFILFSIHTKGQGEYAEIIYDGVVVDTIPLDTDIEYSPDFNSRIVIEVKNGKIHFKESDCPDKVCVHTGWLSLPGQTAVCLPNKTSVVIKSGSDKNAIDTQI